MITDVHAGFAGFGDQLQQTAELPVEDGIACRGPPPRSTDASISAADRRRDTMKTTLDGVVFLLPHVSGHAKNGVSPQADFPRTERRARKRHAPFGRVGRAAGGGRQGGRTARWQGSGRQATRQRAARRRAARRRAARRQSSRTAVGRAAEKEGIAIFFEKKLKTILSENHMSPHPGGKAASSQRTDPGRRPHKQKTGETHNVPPVLAPGFQPPGAAGQRKSARRSSPASAKGQRTGSQYAVRTPGRVQYYPHGRR